MMIDEEIPSSVDYTFRMANLVNNLGGQEGGQVGLETLLQT